LLNLPPTPDPDDPFHREAQETYDTLVSAGLAVDVIPEPSHHRKRLKLDFVASYVNFYVCNGAVIAPQFGDATTSIQILWGKLAEASIAPPSRSQVDKTDGATARMWRVT